MDQNDNRPAFLQEAFTGRVLEGAAPGETGRRPRAGRGCREGLCEARNPGCPSSKNSRGPSESLKISKQVSEEGPFPQVNSSHFPFQYKFQTQKSAPGSGGFSGVLFSPKANDFSLLLRGHLEPSTPHPHPVLTQGPKHPQASLGCDSPPNPGWPASPSHGLVPTSLGARGKDLAEGHRPPRIWGYQGPWPGLAQAQAWRLISCLTFLPVSVARPPRLVLSRVTARPGSSCPGGKVTAGQELLPRVARSLCFPPYLGGSVPLSCQRSQV